MRLESLTGLRFYAAALVVVHHVPWFFALPTVGRVGYAGSVGVSFFFLLSGFVLTWACEGRAVQAVAFYWRRFARVWPAYALVTVAVVAAPFPVLEAADARALPANLLLINGWSYFGSVLPPGWSLSAEAFFYALFPLLVVRLPLRRARLGLLVAAAMLVWPVLAVRVVGDPNATLSLFLVYKLPAYRLGEFVVGMLLAHAMRAGWRPPVGLGTSAAAAAGMYGLVTLATPTGWLAAQMMLGPLVLLVAAAAARDLAGGSRLGRGWHLRLGRWSYALYLVHWPVFAAVAAAGLTGAAGAGAGAVVAVGVAGALFVSVERPLERWLRVRPPRFLPGRASERPDPAAEPVG